MRWTIYTAIIIAVIGVGYWLTFTQRPDTYTPRDAPDPSIFGDDEPAAPDDDQGDGGDDAGDEKERWTVQITGVVEGLNELDGAEDEQYLGIQLSYEDEGLEATGEPPAITSPVLMIGSKELVNDRLGRSPEFGEWITVHSSGTEEELRSLAIRNIEFVD